MERFDLGPPRAVPPYMVFPFHHHRSLAAVFAHCRVCAAWLTEKDQRAGIELCLVCRQQVIA